MLSVREIFPLSKLGLWESNNLKKTRTVWHPAVTAAFRFCTHMNLSSVHIRAEFALPSEFYIYLKSQLLVSHKITSTPEDSYGLRCIMQYNMTTTTNLTCIFFI